jgi:gliding motility-associated-like protein
MLENESRIDPMMRIILLSVFFLAGGGFASAQNQYVSDCNYHTLAVSPLANIPGVNWVNEDNTAYDSNHQRLFFQGGPNPRPPWNLYVIDATSGAVLFNSPIPAGNVAGTISGMQYDNSVDTLYAIYFDGGGVAHFSWIDFTTGTVHPKQIIDGFPGYSGSTYDSAAHLYICYDGGQLLSIDARTGNVVYSGTFTIASTFDLVYDNASSLLYGISEIASGPATFDSVSLATGALHPITTLTVQAFPQINAFTIDEGAGNFIFVGTLPSVTSCINYRLYTVNLNSATIVDSPLYPYAQDASDPLDSNLIEFSFDNRRGALYALNWRPTLFTIPPIITISAATDSVCPGQADLFAATLSSAQAINNYQWLVNNQPVGGNTPTYTDTGPKNGDSIRCILLATTACGSMLTDTSSAVVLTVPPAPPTALRITASADTICAGDTVVFQALPTNGGNAPQYQWLVDGLPAGSNSDLFNSTALANGDSVTCILQSSLTCSLPDTARDAVFMTVKPTPGLRMPPDTVITRGQQILLAPQIEGGDGEYQWQPSTGLSNSAIPDPVASPVSTTTYQLTVADSDGCSAAGKVTIRVSTPLFMPDAFTPNNDGRNDIFRIPPSLSIQLSRFSIFDRWGVRVFATTNVADGWDGTMGSSQAPAGAYVWVIEYIDPFTGGGVTRTGTVILIR